MANCEAKLKLNADCIGVVGVDSRSTSTDGVAGSWSTDGVAGSWSTDGVAGSWSTDGVADCWSRHITFSMVVRSCCCWMLFLLVKSSRA